VKKYWYAWKLSFSINTLETFEFLFVQKSDNKMSEYYILHQLQVHDFKVLRFFS